MKTFQCRNNPEIMCSCRKVTWTKWLYLIPIAVCLLFSVLFLELEKRYQDHAYDVLAEDKHLFFNKIMSVVPTLDSLIKPTCTKYIVETISNTNFNYGFINYQPNDTSNLLLKDLNYYWVDSIPIFEYQSNLTGKTRVYVYRYDEQYWVFSAIDGGLINVQRGGLGTLILLSLLVTLVLNLILIFKINQNIYGKPK
jgi:hypothetical protein